MFYFLLTALKSEYRKFVESEKQSVNLIRKIHSLSMSFFTDHIFILFFLIFSSASFVYEADCLGMTIKISTHDA